MTWRNTKQRMQAGIWQTATGKRASHHCYAAVRVMLAIMQAMNAEPSHGMHG